MNAIDTNLYNYLDDKWRSQYDSWSNNPAGYTSFADVMASTSEGQLYLDQLLSTGAVSASMYSVTDSGASGAGASAASSTSGTDGAGGGSASAADGATAGAASSPTVADNFYDFTTDDWQAANPDKMALLNQEPGMGAFLGDNPEWGSIFVNGSQEDASAVCAQYERIYYGEAYNPGELDLTT